MEAQSSPMSPLKHLVRPAFIHHAHASQVTFALWVFLASAHMDAHLGRLHVFACSSTEVYKLGAWNRASNPSSHTALIVSIRDKTA